MKKVLLIALLFSLTVNGGVASELNGSCDFDVVPVNLKNFDIPVGTTHFVGKATKDFGYLLEGEDASVEVKLDVRGNATSLSIVNSMEVICRNETSPFVRGVLGSMTQTYFD